MTCRYLFGPVTADFADQNLRRQRTSGECLTFDPAGATDLAIRPGGTWTAVTERLPPGWQPDFVALYLPYTPFRSACGRPRSRWSDWPPIGTCFGITTATLAAGLRPRLD